MSLFFTERLNIRAFHADDAPFIVELLNDESFIKNIGDRKVRTHEDAVLYLVNGPIASYMKHGFGLWMVELKPAGGNLELGTPIGMCGLIKRETLADVDIGFAFLPRFAGQGYAYEAAIATRNYARDIVKLKRLVAITMLHNTRSMKLLEKIGMKLEGQITLPDGTNNNLFAIDFE